jgi:hypothetical protein
MERIQTYLKKKKKGGREERKKIGVGKRRKRIGK